MSNHHNPEEDVFGDDDRKNEEAEAANDAETTDREAYAKHLDEQDAASDLAMQDEDHDAQAISDHDALMDHYADEQHRPQAYTGGVDPYEQPAAPVAFLNFDKGYVEMDLETLRRTISMELATGGLPKSRPINHFEFIDAVIDIAKKKIAPGVAVKVDNIIASEAQAKRLLWAGEKDKCPVEKYYIERLVAKIRFVMEEDEQLGISMALAISFNEQGIAVAFGPEVRICSNQNIFGDNMICTYGDRKMPYDKILEVIGVWMDEFKVKREQDMGMITKLRGITVYENDFFQIIGKLFVNAVGYNSGDKELDAPLNQTQVANMVREYITWLGENPTEEGGVADMSLWDVTNFGTMTLKPDSANMTTLLQDIRGLNNFLLKMFGQNN